MHRIAATPGGWNPETEGVVFIEQNPAPLVFLTAADTEIQTLAKALPLLPSGFPELRVSNLLQLQQQLSIDTYAEEVLTEAKVIVLRLLGGRAYWSYGLEVVKQTVEETGAALFVLPGDDRPDPDLISHSTVPLTAVNQLWRYLIEGGIENTINAFKFIANTSLGQHYDLRPAQPIPRVGLYEWRPLASISPRSPQPPTPNPQIGILFYRAHYLSGNTAPIDALCQALVERQLEPVPIFVSSLRDPDVQTDLLTHFQLKDGCPIQVLLNATSFSLARLDSETPNVDLWKQLDVPVIQVILSGGTVEKWRSQTRGLSPRDVAMNVALPEVDGRIISRAISFKTVQVRNPSLETDVVGYKPVDDRIQFVADLAANWAHLRQTPVGDRRIALILANYPTRDGRLANGVGLDTPASCIEILKALEQAGYSIDNIPASGDELIQRLTQGITNDPEGQDLRQIHQSLPLEDYQKYFATLPKAVQQGIGDRWNTPPSHLPISGLQLGNIFIGIQPARGYDLDPSLNYHAPDLEPTHEYLAFYHWLRSHFKAQAIAHIGKHGNLEWLPGKGVALSKTCYPEVALGALPHLYPFIVNDPGEGAQAKRRAQAVILDHLTPPMTRAELYGALQQLEGLIDEYYEAQSLDPTRLSVISDRITALVLQENLHQDLGVQSDNLETIDQSQLKTFISEFITRADGYLCELKEAQIRDGLHIFGKCPQGRQLRDLVVAIARHPGQGRLGLTRAIAQHWQLDFDPLTANPADSLSSLGTVFWNAMCSKNSSSQSPTHRTVGDAIEQLEQLAASLVESLLTPDFDRSEDVFEREVFDFTLKNTASLSNIPDLHWIATHLLPSLQQTEQEITHFLHGLDGRYVPSGASGAPTRGRPEVLPTGRNFYSVDIRAIPTESAWDVGRKAAEALIEQYTQEHGDYPKTLALSIWGTSTMRTGGDDLAEALALLGVQPVWDGSARRVVDFEVLPLSVLGRPRVDVTLRISGFFRDAFPNLIDLFDQAVRAVAALNEPPEQNPLAAQVQQEVETWQTAGLTPEQAERRSHYRIFGSKPGAYGAGLQGLIESQNWTDDQDLARAYINWSSYAYTGQGEARTDPEAFKQRLQQLQVVLHNQDNREHDLLDSDDYYQFQGGLTAAVRSLTGANPTTYFGDHSLPENPKIRKLQQEIAKVYRSRVVNPKWIAGVMRHGYKGAFEMAATVDYLFAYDATTHCVEDHMYQGIAQAYLFDSEVQQFVEQKNPWALRDMAERLLEANQRGLWQNVPNKTLDELKAIALQAEAVIESNTDNQFR
ncbi:cobaltochelatase subunit CobN [Leptolyngbya sp. FACHB-671]|uniref:cobaltochelatase subunit CobN n=1 Tax=Leptolyngbya sp. FACHB-671 TaxID=2692812 RepID=UPI0016820A34|nr:cobaltochelatase subunit CobN [Leptolyngbya sp. FACHB-671]MBD2069592.1 cobaltochelatase subunit CobN [Leptolyngbya sp. FACHB-671]